jgi:predicted transcriptional regulator
MKQLRRDRLKIYMDLLRIIRIESRRERIVLTRLQQKSNVPYDRLKTYLGELKERGLIEDETAPRLTERGRQSLAEYEQVIEFMKRMGLAFRA